MSARKKLALAAVALVLASSGCAPLDDDEVIVEDDIAGPDAGVSDDATDGAAELCAPKYQWNYLGYIGGYRTWSWQDCRGTGYQKLCTWDYHERKRNVTIKWSLKGYLYIYWAGSWFYTGRRC